MDNGKHGTMRKGIFTLSTLTMSCFFALNAQAAVDCTDLAEWESNKVYTGGDQVQQNGVAYKANYWTQNNAPKDFSGQYSQWVELGLCSDTEIPVENVAPSASITAPTATSSITTGETVLIKANATDTDGTVAKVDFLVDGTVVGSSTTAPYEFAWVATEGAHSLAAVAYDDKNAASSQASVYR